MATGRFAYPLTGVYAGRFYGDRWALIGDAAIGMHPVTAHGFNLGLRAAEILSGVMTRSRDAGQPIWDTPGLRAYNRELRRVSMPLYHATNALVQLYTDSSPMAHVARAGVLRAGMLLKPARGVLVRTLMDSGQKRLNRA